MSNISKTVSFTKISRDDFDKMKQDQEHIKIGYHDNIIDNNIQRKDVVTTLNKTLFNKVMLMFESNQNVNSLFIDTYEDSSDIDFMHSSNISYDKMNTCIRLKQNEYLAYYYTRWIYTNDKDNSKMNNFYLLVEDTVYHDCSVEYFLETNNGNLYPIASNNKNALTVSGEDKIPTSVRIKAIIKKHKYSNNIPFINGISLMYEDEYTKSQLDIFNPNFQLTEESSEDVLTLFRDNTNDDILYKTEDNKTRTELIYDDNNTLMYIDVYEIKTGKRVSRTELIYEDYLNSAGKIEVVLGKIKTIKSK